MIIEIIDPTASNYSTLLHVHPCLYPYKAFELGNTQAPQGRKEAMALNAVSTLWGTDHCAADGT